VNGIQLLVVVLGAIGVTALAQRKGMQPALVVVVLAAAVSFVPGLPRFQLDPELILAVVVPPLLYATALDFSFESLRRAWHPILSLGVAMVVVSTAATMLAAHLVEPALPWAAALVLGAVVAPPDAVTGLAIGRELGLPRRLMTVLTGESLLNDAAALTIYSLGLAAVSGTHTVLSNPFALFGYGAAVGVLLGIALGKLVHWIRLRLRDSGLSTAVNVITPFAAYLLGEGLGASGVLAVVFAGFTVGHRDATSDFASRLQSREVWRALGSVLEAFVFAYMGLQCRFVFDDLWATGVAPVRFLLIAAVVLGTVLLVRPAWLFLSFGNRRLLTGLGRRLLRRPRPPGQDEYQPGWRALAVVSWTGMRGVITLAAAAGVPTTALGGGPFPGRTLIQALAFVVSVGTIVAQGTTLPLLIRKLDIRDPGEARWWTESLRRAHRVTRQAADGAMARAREHPPEGATPEVLSRLARRVDAALEARRRLDDEEVGSSEAVRRTMRAVRRDMLAAQRAGLIEARESGQLPDTVVRVALERLDYEEAANSHDDA
jgi:monovalent cation/hydrogen antiporter